MKNVSPDATNEDGLTALHQVFIDCYYYIIFKKGWLAKRIKNAYNRPKQQSFNLWKGDDQSES